MSNQQRFQTGGSGHVPMPFLKQFYKGAYRRLRDRETPVDEAWKESWDLYRCWQRGWVPEKL